MIEFLYICKIPLFTEVSGLERAPLFSRVSFYMSSEIIVFTTQTILFTFNLRKAIKHLLIYIHKLRIRINVPKNGVLHRIFGIAHSYAGSF